MEENEELTEEEENLLIEEDHWSNSDCPLVFCLGISGICLVIITIILLFENSNYYFMPAYQEKLDLDRHIMNK